MKFTKVEGCGNHFILIDEIKSPSLSQTLDSHLIRSMCDPHFGIGADGILYVRQHFSGHAGSDTDISHSDLYEMLIFNADGSEAQMCGNGLRCVVKYLSNHYQLFSDKTKKVSILTGGGLFQVQKTQDHSSSLIGVEMGWPATISQIKLSNYPFTLYSFGNPHVVTYNPQLFTDRLTLAPKINADISDGVNVSFAQQVSSDEIILHVHERGCGWTLACGTGACASVYHGYLNGKFTVGQTIKVHLPGGELAIEINDQGLLMWGPAREVFTGEILAQDQNC